MGEPVGEAAVPRPLHGCLPRVVDHPDPRRDPLLVQRGPFALHGPGLVAALVHGGSQSLRPQRSRVELGASAEPQARGTRRARDRSARSGSRDRAHALAWTRGGNRARRFARDARDARDRDGNGAAPRLRRAPDLRPARHPRPGDRPHHVLARVRRDHRARSPARDRASGRGGGTRDLGASRLQAVRLALLPMLVPAIVASGSSSSRSRWTTS